MRCALLPSRFSAKLVLLKKCWTMIFSGSLCQTSFVFMSLILVSDAVMQPLHYIQNWLQGIVSSSWLLRPQKLKIERSRQTWTGRTLKDCDSFNSCRSQKSNGPSLILLLVPTVVAYVRLFCLEILFVPPSPNRSGLWVSPWPMATCVP